MRISRRRYVPSEPPHPLLSSIPSPRCPLSSPCFPHVYVCGLCDSARTAMLTCGRRTTGSSGYVLSWLISAPQAGIRAPMEHSRILSLSPISQFDFIERDGLEAPPTGQNKDNVYQCKKHSSASTLRFLFHPLPLASLSFLLFHFQETQKRYSCFIFSVSECNQCYGWKKQITRARTAAKKAGRK